jgi:SPP1 family predicted phage head-tail adaptor
VSYQPLDAGMLDKRIIIQSPTLTPQDGGGQDIDWTIDPVTVWASLSATGGSEFIAAQQLQPELTHEVKLRYRTGVTAKHRLVFGSRIFSVHAVLNPLERNEQLALYCSELASTAAEAVDDDLGDTPEAIAIIKALLGPMVDVADLPVDVPSFYESNWNTNEAAQWIAFGPLWDPGNSISGYDRAAILYAWYARTGNATYLDHAHQTVVNYRDSYVIPALDAGSAPAEHWSQMEGLYLHWKLTGDVASKNAVIGTAAKFSQLVFNGYVGTVGSDVEPRIQTRVMLALWIAELIDPTNTLADWTSVLDGAIAQVLATLGDDGYAAFPSTCGGSLQYMQGMLYDFLGRLYDQRPKVAYNATILAKMTTWATWAWATQWRGPSDPSFNYISVDCTDTGSPTSAPDENGQILTTFGWLGKTTADSAWFTKGDQILAGMVGADTELYRQFSQNYTSSYRYIGYKHPELV